MIDNILWQLLNFINNASIFNLPIIRKVIPLFYKKMLRSDYTIKLGNRVDIKSAHKNAKAKFVLGPGLAIGSNAYIDYTGSIYIGKNVTISEGARIYTHDHILDGDKDWQKNGLKHSSLTLGDYVWVGSNALIMNSVSEIGEGAIIAAGSVVTKNVEPYTIVAGIPAKFIRNRSIY